jgi:hypothetical protein
VFKVGDKVIIDVNKIKNFYIDKRVIGIPLTIVKVRGNLLHFRETEQKCFQEHVYSSARDTKLGQILK